MQWRIGTCVGISIWRYRLRNTARAGTNDFCPATARVHEISLSNRSESTRLNLDSVDPTQVRDW